MRLSLLCEQIIEPTSEMIDYFYYRTCEHIDRVIQNMKKVDDRTDYDHDVLISRGQSHDESKYQNEVELVPYIWLTEFYRCQNSGQDFEYPSGIESQVDAACLHHVQNNRHHPEFHDDINSMSDIDIIEMVCDWTAMSQELGQDGGSAKGWADKNIGSKWNFNNDRIDLIYYIIDVIDND
ncbi:MAG: hypothetical protein GF411_14790 [Candidatus Lokiarchaeota archaeon]|nr:hypothetical protein [Candidatus Lokiarchaeota archaeon]